jgi:hypothetical protein
VIILIFPNEKRKGKFLKENIKTGKEDKEID